MNLKKNDLHKEVETISRQFELAAHVAVEMLKEGQLDFYLWYEEVTKKCGSSETPDDNLQLIWIWNSLRQHPILKKELRDLSPAGMHWNRNSLPVLVLKKGSWFIIGLTQNRANSLLFPRTESPSDSQAAFQLLDDLYMRPGRNDRLECCDCPCLLQLRPDEIFSEERELDLLGVGIERFNVIDSELIRIEVATINQAYTVASRRLQPKRRSHGGNVYQHVIYVGPQRRYRLEDIRFAVELGEWELSSPQLSTSSDHPLFPDDC